MINLIFAIFTRILSNSYLNVFQKNLTQKGESPSIVNLYTYLGLTTIAIILFSNPYFTYQLIPYILTMGFLGALENYFVVKSLSLGELSSVAPINSYKPIVALVFGYFLLNEKPGIIELCGIVLIIIGTFFLGNSKIFYNKATLYRFIALILLGTEALFIKKVVLLSNVNSAFLYWVSTGLLFAIVFAILSKHQLKIKPINIKYQIALIIMVALMQYTTTYIFSKMNVAYV